MTYKKRRRSGALRERIKRVLLYSAIFFVLAILEVSFFSRLDLLPISPSLVLGAVAAISVLDDQRTALVAAIIGGAVVDALGGAGVYLSPICFFIAALVISSIAKKMMQGFWSYLALLPVASLFGCALTLAERFLYAGSFLWGRVLLTVTLPEFFITVLLSLPLFFIIKLLAGRLLHRAYIMKGDL